MSQSSRPLRPLKLLIVCPSWLGDVVMATPALRLIRDAFPGCFIGGLVRPGLDELLSGTTFFDELHVERSQGIMGPKRVAAKVRGRGYDTALLFTNSFSTALITRLAFIPRRVGYDRDGRGILLTDRLPQPPVSASISGGVVTASGRVCISAVDYYLFAARALIERAQGEVSTPISPSPVRLELATSPVQDDAAHALLRRAGIDGKPGAAGAAGGAAYAVLNPGANDALKRWPAERFAQVASHLIRTRGWRVLVNGSPAERDLCDEVVRFTEDALAHDRPAIPEPRDCVSLPAMGITIGTLKGVVRGARLMVTNDTGPRHIASAFGVPVVTLYGPTDPRWTTLPSLPETQTGRARREDVVADPTLPADLVADDHPERCRIDRIEVERVISAVGRALAHA